MSTARRGRGSSSPSASATSVGLEGGRPVLDLRIDDERQTEWSPMIPDHGKLMHLFLVREPGLDAFAHLHPVAQGAADFRVALPPLPAGTYRLYADVVHESGFPQTLVDRVKIPASPASAVPRASMPPPPIRTTPGASPSRWRRGWPPPDRSSAFWTTAAPCSGTSPRWGRTARPPCASRSAARTAEPAALEPYMGMLSHAVIADNRRDTMRSGTGEVFVHLHPMGTVSMAAQQAFAKKGREEGVRTLPPWPRWPA